MSTSTLSLLLLSLALLFITTLANNNNDNNNHNKLKYTDDDGQEFLSCLNLFDTDVYPKLEEKFSQDYFIQKGQFVWFGAMRNSDCSADEAVGCHYDNPSSPYGFLQLPPPVGENPDDHPDFLYLDKAYSDKSYMRWRLRGDEVVVVVGCSPPPAKFFSFQHTLMEYWNPYRQGFDHVVGSLGKTVHILDIKTNTSKSFNSPFAMSLTQDQQQLRQVNEILSGFLPHGYNNTLRLPNRLFAPDKESWFRETHLNYGLGLHSDTFAILLRVAFPKTPFAQRWSKTPGHIPGLRAFRLTPKVEKPVTEPFPPPRIEIPAMGGDNEFWLRGAFDHLQQAILDKYTPTYNYRRSLGSIDRYDPFIPVWGGECAIGYLGIPWFESISSTNCQIDTRDAVYVSPVPKINLARPETFAYFMGVNHAKTNLSTYFNIGFYNDYTKTSLINLYDEVDIYTDQKLETSAVEYLRGTIYEEYAPYLYIIKVSTQCEPNEKYCLQVPTSADLWKKREPASSVLAIERAYLNVKTGEASDGRAMIHPAYIVFHPNISDLEFFTYQASSWKPVFVVYLYIRIFVEKIVGKTNIWQYGWKVALSIVFSYVVLGFILLRFAIRKVKKSMTSNKIKRL